MTFVPRDAVRSQHVEQPARCRAQKAAAACHRNDLLPGDEIANADDRKGASRQFLRGVIVRKQRQAEACFDQTLLSRQTVDGCPGQIAQTVRLKQ